MLDIEIPKPASARRMSKREEKRYLESLQPDPKWWRLHHAKVSRAEQRKGETFQQALDRFMQDMKDRTPRTYKRFFKMLRDNEVRRKTQEAIAAKKAKGRARHLKRFRNLSTQRDYT